MVTLILHRLKHVSTGFDASKVVTMTWKTKNVQGDQKSSKMRNCKGVVYYELLKPCETVTGDRYRMQLIKMEHALNNKRRNFASKKGKVLFHDDNAKPHRAAIVKKKIEDFGWDRLDQAAYSPDLAPSDYYLFRSMQIDLADVRFRNAEEVRKWVDDWNASKDEEFFRRGIHKLPKRWQEVITNDGEYIR